MVELFILQQCPDLDNIITQEGSEMKLFNWSGLELLRRSGSALKITRCPLQGWQLNNSTRGPSEKINTHKIAKMWMQFVVKVDLM